MSARNFFTAEQQQQIAQAITDAEKNTSGEIRVHIENKCPEDPVERGKTVFVKLAMHKTELKNGVLFYLAVDDHKFAILGDTGINELVPHDFWDHIRDHMQDHFRAGRFTEGLAEGIARAGEALKAHFPYKADDRDELSNEVTFDRH
jgi:uncharacterized membrane protein